MDTKRATKLLDAEERRIEDLRHTTELQSLSSQDEAGSVAELADYDQHPGDVATETFEREKRLSILNGLDAELAEVHASRERLVSGRYGICEACGQPIDDARLEAQPAARFCLEDQQKAERGV